MKCTKYQVMSEKYMTLSMYCEDSWVPPPLHQALSSICLTAFAWLHIEIAISISHLVFFTSHLFLSQLKSSFFFHHPSKTALSKVSNNPWIVRCNDIFSAFIWFQVYISWLFWVLPVWNFAVYIIALCSSSSVDNVSESFTGSFISTCSLRVGVKIKSCSFALISPRTTQFLFVAKVAISRCEIPM